MKEISHNFWIKAGHLSARLRGNGQTLPMSDVIIAAPALEHGCTVVTIDRLFAVIPGLQIADVPSQKLSRDIHYRIPLTITTATLPAGTSGIAYAATALAATGGVKPYVWSIASGALPPGIGLNTATGTISGTPTTKGTYPFTVQVSDQQTPPAVTTKALSITVN